MGESADMCQKRYVDFLKRKFKTCLIHVSGIFSDECKVLRGFGAKYDKSNTNKYHGNHPVPKKKINRQLENNAIINNMVDEILLNETQKKG